MIYASSLSIPIDTPDAAEPHPIAHDDDDDDQIDVQRSKQDQASPIRLEHALIFCHLGAIQLRLPVLLSDFHR